MRIQIRRILERTLLRFNSTDHFGVVQNRLLRGARDYLFESHGKPIETDREPILAEIRKTIQKQSDEFELIDILMESAQTDFVLDAIELVFRLIVGADHKLFTCSAAEAVELLNRRFRENGLGYEFEIESQILVRVDNRFLHDTAVKPALHLLTSPKFKAANDEFLDAHRDFKNGDFRSCVDKCCAAMESVMKVVCIDKEWSPPHKQDWDVLNATAAPLVEACVSNTDLPSFFAQPLVLIATIRNKLGKAHGSGTVEKNVSIHVARYALHSTASAIVLLTDVAN